MAAFVAANPTAIVSSTASSFVGNAPVCDDRSRPRAASRRCTTTMNVLNGLDTVNQDSYGFSRFILGPFQPKVLYAESDDGEREDIIRAAYRHVFGNAYIMEEERDELAVAESQFKLGALSAREFVRALGKSSAYKTRFFEGASQYRFIELNFMHFLGRAPDSQAEISEHVQRYAAAGVDADIDSYIDSDEYGTVFGEDNIPFLRFRGAYTPCDSFNKQCALKGGWANSDKAMGGAASSGYNGSDGAQVCDRIAAYATNATTPYEEVAENTPLKTTSPNWYAVPDPALAPTPAYVSVAEVRALQDRVTALEAQYDVELKKKLASKDQLAPFRSMVSDMGVLLDRGFAYSGGDPLLANPYAKILSEDSALADGGCKSSDYIRFHKQMETDSLSRTEKDLEEARASLRILSKALDASTPVTPPIQLPGQVAGSVISAIIEESERSSRPRIQVSGRPKPTPAAPKEGLEIAGVKLPAVSLPGVKLPSFKLPGSS